MITAKTKINVIIGDPVDHSLSPQMHNSAYKALGIDSEFVYVAFHVEPVQLKQAIEGLKALQVNGITVTIPHKENVLEFVDELEETARKIGAVNTIINRNGTFVGVNTDWIGFIKPLQKIIDVKNKTVAVLGAGGAAHAAVFALTKHEAKVTVFNRTKDHAKIIAEKFNCNFASIDNLAQLENTDIIINTTSVGMQSHDSLVPKELLHKGQIVFDAVYVPFETQLLQNAKEQGATIIHGTDLLLHQGIAQFELFTNKKAPIDVMEKAIMENINI